MLAGCAGDLGTDTTVRIAQTDDRRVPAAEVTLPDGRTLQVTASEVVVRDDVEVTRRPSAYPDLDVLTVRGDATVLVHGDAPGEPVDGVLLHARGFDPPFERGEVDYAEPPQVPAVVVPAGEPVAAALVPAVDVVCVEVVSPEVAGRGDRVLEPPLAGRSVPVPLRRSDDPLALACTADPPTGPALDAVRWSAERLGHQPPDEDASSIPPATLLARLDRDAEVIELHARGDVTDLRFRWPRDTTTLVVFAGEGRWSWAPEAEPEPASDPDDGVAAGPTLPATGLREPGAGLFGLEVCALVEGTGGEVAPTVLCTAVANW